MSDESHSNWIYVTHCKVCDHDIGVAADEGVTPATSRDAFTVQCPKCGSQIELDASMLKQPPT